MPVELTKGGQAIEVSDLEVGDQVRFSQTRNDDGTYTVDAIAVVVPSVRGTVSDVSSTGFKVTTRDGSVWTIAINGTTKYQYGAGDGHARGRDERRPSRSSRAPRPATTP